MLCFTTITCIWCNFSIQFIEIWQSKSKKLLELVRFLKLQATKGLKDMIVQLCNHGRRPMNAKLSRAKKRLF